LQGAKSDILLKQSDICPDGASDIFPCGKVVVRFKRLPRLRLAMTERGMDGGYRFVVTERVGKLWKRLKNF